MFLARPTKKMTVVTFLLATSAYGANEYTGGKNVSTNPKPPAAAKPHLVENLADELPKDIEDYRWKIGPGTEGTGSGEVQTFFVNEVGNRMVAGSIAVGTVVKPTYVRKFGGKNYFCVPTAKKVQGAKSLPPPYNCDWLSGIYIIPDGKIETVKK